MKRKNDDCNKETAEKISKELGITEVISNVLPSQKSETIKMLKEKGRVGMVNTCLRIRMMTEDTAQFSVESEPGIGTLVSIRFPLNKAIRAE